MMNLSKLSDLFWGTPYWLRIIILMVIGPIMNYIGLNQIGVHLPFETVVMASWMLTWVVILYYSRWPDLKRDGEKDEKT